MPDATSPAEELKQLQAEFEKTQQDAARLKARIADLEKTVKEVEQKTKDYEKSSAGNRKQAKELADYVDNEKKMLEAAVDEEKIAQRKAAAERALDDLEKQAAEATSRVRDLQEKADEARAKAAAARNEYDAVAQRAAANAEILKELAALQKQAEEQDRAKNHARKYFLILLMEELSEKLQLTHPEQFAAELTEAANGRAAAVKAELDAEGELEKAKAAEKEAVKKHEDSRVKWVETTLATIDQGGGISAPVPPAAAPDPPQPPSPV